MTYNELAKMIDGWWQRLFGLPEPVPAAVCGADAEQLRAAKQAERLSNTRAALKVADESDRPRNDDDAMALAVLWNSTVPTPVGPVPLFVAPAGHAPKVIAPRVGLTGKPTAMEGELYTAAHTMREQADDLYAYLLANAPGELADFIDNTARNFELQRERLRQSNVQNVLTGGGQLKAMVARDFYAMLAVLGLIDVMDRQKQKGGA